MSAGSSVNENENRDLESANAKGPNKQKNLDSKKLRKFKSLRRSLRFLKLLIILNGVCLAILIYLLFYLNLHGKHEYWNVKIDIHNDSCGTRRNENTLPQDCATSTTKSIQRLDAWSEYFPNGIPETLNCPELFNNDTDAFAKYDSSGRLQVFDDIPLSMDCESIKRRIIGDIKFSQLERPIAFARNIFEDYITQEAFISLSYHPDNAFCFVIDSKSDIMFVDRMRQLDECLENVFVSETVYDMDSSGHFQDHAHLDCLNFLLEQNKKWKHVLLLQNHDFIIKSPKGLSDISKLLNETHAIGIQPPDEARYNKDADWTPRGLKLWKNETGKTETQLSTSLTIGKSTNEVFLSRTFVEAIFEELNMERLLNQINDPQFYGVDEIFFHTLVINSWMRLPGQIQNLCGLSIRNLARWTHWDYGKDSTHCHSKALRHNICILGVEYLPIVRDRPEILANKVNQEFDFGTILCMRKSMNLIESGSMIEGHLETKHYERLPQVKQMKLMQNGDTNLTTFKC